LAIFVMLLCSGLGLLLKYASSKNILWRRRKWWWHGDSRFHGKPTALSFEYRLTRCNLDVESGTSSSFSSTAHKWGDIQAVRRYQQETYTATLRLRRRYRTQL
jgi:hypothetical protein